MKIENGLNVLEITGEGPEKIPMTVNLTLLSDEKEALLIDAAAPFQEENIISALDSAGVPFSSLSGIIVTHHDMDHIGSLEALVKKSKGRINVMSHELEEPYITGEKISIKMSPERISETKEKLKNLPENEKIFMEQLFARRDVKVNKYLNEGDVLPNFGGIVAIHTPGHTPGHLCLYLEKYKILVAGDAMILENGRLHGPSPGFSYKIEEARNSLKKFKKYDIRTVICYHGGVYTNNPNARINELASGLE